MTNLIQNLPEKIVRISVTNDLVTDKRVDKTAKTLSRLGFKVVLIGRKKKDSSLLSTRLYSTQRFSLPFEKGPLFYACYNIWLFIYLIFNKSHLLVANDLDTLPANYFIHLLKNIPLVYDSHEYFTGVPELTSRPKVQRIWKIIERYIFPKLHDVITVNESIANLYSAEYGILARVVRNVPETITNPDIADKVSLGISINKSIIILQGAGINVDRGAEEAVLAMKYLDNVLLLIIGGGDVIDNLKVLIIENQLGEKVQLIPKQPMNTLVLYTKCGDIGLTLDKDTNINYKFSLPNKLFDYIQAGIPILASALPEIQKIVEGYQIGMITKSHDPKHIAECIQKMLVEKNQIDIWKENLKIAARELCWENEEIVLREVYAKYL